MRSENRRAARRMKENARNYWLNDSNEPSRHRMSKRNSLRYDKDYDSDDNNSSSLKTKMADLAYQEELDLLDDDMS